ncbi:hypothetical protein KSP39_PZI007817 [Platanthera zijinensis]|uniref:Pentatricopeptide repeat-containing protein n=1 Tax=Platanthera zijinensis TaxID=2320716 RepID=A0AAP0BNV6_9ASPA
MCYDKFQDSGISPDIKTFNNLLDSYRKARRYEKMSAVMEYMHKYNFSWTLVTYNVVIDAFRRAGDLKQMEHDAETAERLRSRVEELETEVKELKAGKTQLKEASTSRLQATPPPAHYTHDEVEDFCRDANIRTAELILKMMREMGVIKDDCEDITARDLVPEIYGEGESSAGEKD